VIGTSAQRDSSDNQSSNDFCSRDAFIKKFGSRKLMQWPKLLLRRDIYVIITKMHKGKYEIGFCITKSIRASFCIHNKISGSKFAAQRSVDAAFLKKVSYMSLPFVRECAFLFSCFFMNLTFFF
jgi:hypothetical protein